MLHGLWSNGSTWNSLRDALLTIGYPRSWAFATSYPNSIRVARQQPGFSARITATLNGPLRDGFVATEIDIVAHSMGGLIAKRFGAQESGRIRSIVTVGTPHLGSPGADLLVALQADLLRAHPKLSWPLTWLFQLTNDKGAVADLRENGGVHVGWSVPNVSTTMIVGVANAQNIVGPPQVGLDDVFFDLSLVFPRTYAKRFPGKDLSTKKLLHDAVFKGRRSDWLVSEPSQAGGATDFEVVDTPVDTMEHTTETNNAEVLSKILLALGTSTTKRLRATTPRRATPRNRNPSGEDSALRKRSGAVESASIDIESPVEGASYAPGDSVHVAVNVTGAPDVVAIATNGDDFEILEAGPYDRTFTIPDDFVGSYTVLVIARNADDRFATAERTVNVTTSATLQTLRVAPDSDPTYLSPGVVVPLDVQGDFSDGVTRNVTAAVTGTTYESSDPTVVTVSADGELTSVGYGAATVTVANSGVTALIHVKSPIDLLTARGTIGSAVHFFGAGFGSRKGSVRVGGRAAKVRRWSDAGVTCVVSSAATVGPADVALRLASKGPGQTVPFPGAFEFVAPTATTFTGAVAPGATLTVAGTYFGTQRGTAALVAEGKPRVALRVKSWTMDADSGASQAVVVLPRNVASGDWQLVLTNRLGPTGVSVTVP
jgi:pimeloyl-ACP methyl ester carboxylesterase